MSGSYPPPLDVAAHLAAIIASSDDVIVSKTLEGVITSWNPAAERIFGYTAAEAVGKHIRMIIPPDRWAEEDDVLARIGRGERVDHFETVRRAKDGRLLNISLTVSPIKDQNGKIVGASKVARDITERKQAERELERLLASEKEARAQAEEASRLKDEFLAVVSHELRTPLNAIIGWASLLRMRKLDDQTMRAIETIQRNAQTQNQLIGDLLDVSRIVSGQLRLNIRPFELISVIERGDRGDSASRRREIDSRADVSSIPQPDRWLATPTGCSRFSGTCCPMRSSSRRPRARFGSDSVESTPTSNSSSPTRARESSRKLLPFVFDRFRQADSSTTREYGGLGLGLAIVRHLVELHGGVVLARSEGEGKGAEFTVQLPIVAAFQSAQPGNGVRLLPGAGASTSGAMPSLAGLRVLLVDDEPDAREMVAAILSEAGAEVITAQRCAAGLRAGRAEETRRVDFGYRHAWRGRLRAHPQGPDADGRARRPGSRDRADRVCAHAGSSQGSFCGVPDACAQAGGTGRACDRRRQPDEETVSPSSRSVQSGLCQNSMMARSAPTRTRSKPTLR